MKNRTGKYSFIVKIWGTRVMSGVEKKEIIEDLTRDPRHEF